MVKSVLVVLLVAGALVHDYVLGPRLQRELREATRRAGDAAAARRRRLVQLRAHDRRPDPRRRRARFDYLE